MGRRLVGAVLAAMTLIGSAGAAEAEGGPPEAPRATGWYLALGDSLAAGYQPGAGDERDGGYVGDVLATVQESAPKTKLVNLACSGATTVSMVAGDRCAYEEGTQLAQAVEFLHAHGRNTRLVTLDVGATTSPAALARRSTRCAPRRPSSASTATSLASSPLCAPRPARTSRSSSSTTTTPSWPPG